VDRHETFGTGCRLLRLALLGEPLVYPAVDLGADPLDETLC
jgi:hypothetical protein